MIDNKKEQERANLHATIWRIANELRGSVDGWDFKQYVLGLLFYRFISENLSSYINNNENQANPSSNFNYATTMADEQCTAEMIAELVTEKGFFIKPSELFENVYKNASVDENLNETLQNIFKNIESSAIGTEAESNIKGLFDDLDVNSNKLGATVNKRNEVLTKLIKAIAELKLGNYGDSYGNNSIDVFGDAYEYLMTMYAANAGKSGGEFFTPQEVSELLTRITIVGKTEVNKVYDPACGSGSLLLNFAKILGKKNVKDGFFGQEINITTYNLCRINMFLHDIGFEKFHIAHGDTLTNPTSWENNEAFEAIVSNPPYSIRWEGDASITLRNDDRFTKAGVLAPKSKADMAFIMHALSCLATSGTAAIVCFPGVMYRSGAEQKIRQHLVEENFVDSVIHLPPDLFFGTSIATSILVLKKNKSKAETFFIDASSEFIRGSAKNKLSSSNIAKILDCYANKTNIEHFSRLVDNSEIAKQDYNLSVSSYVEQKNTKEIVNIVELNAKLNEIVKKQSMLRAEIDAIVDEIEGINE